MNQFLTDASCLWMQDGAWERKELALVQECALSITLNGTALPEMSCSPVHIKELVIGHLLTQGHMRDLCQLVELTIDEAELPDRAHASVQIRDCQLSDRPETKAMWDVSQLQALSEYVIRDAAKHRSAHSTHSCTLMRAGELCCCCEDIGRHNAIDRAVGRAHMSGIALGECIAFFSGRVSCEAIRRAATAGITVFCAKGLPTAQAARLAQEKQLTLLHCSEKRGVISFTSDRA